MGTYLDARDAGAMGADHGVPDDDPPPAPTVAWLTSQQLEAFWDIARQAENLSSAAEELESKADALAYEAKSLQEQAAKPGTLRTGCRSACLRPATTPRQTTT